MRASPVPPLAAVFFLGVLGGSSSGADEEVFDPAPVLRLRIELPPASRKVLQENDGRSYARAVVREGETVYSDVGIKIKGSAGSRRELNDKPGLTLKFDQFIPGRRFHGLKKLHLNNCAQDPSYLSEIVGNELFRAAGVPAQRNGFARVELDGRDKGLYVIAEAVTRDFLARWFPDASGALFEGPGEINGDLDGDSRAGTAIDRSGLKALAEAASESDPQKRLLRLEQVLDLERFLSFLAMEAITSHWDGYAVGVNNFHVYHNPLGGKVVFIPHGTDQLFQQPGAPAEPHGGGMVARAVLSTKEARRRYRERLKDLLEKVFVPQELSKRIRALSARIRPALAEGDPGRAAEHDELVSGLIARIEERARFLREQVVPAPALEFDGRGVARPRGWERRIQSGGPQLLMAPAEGAQGGAALKIAAEGGSCQASFRTRVLLSPGRYLFTGLVRTSGVTPGKGAALRVSGRQPDHRVIGDEDWKRFEFEVVVDGEEGWEGEEPPQGLELVCELHAVRGTAWFDEGSLELVRQSPGKPGE